ncbi:hypothetical protein Sjap_025618 [Stephania japonica]|uniref:Uncharacterized protein n=1 Tax=Stephania japonica TaxID=461633 RepID=A0AAP0E5I7_9MAGN
MGEYGWMGGWGGGAAVGGGLEDELGDVGGEITGCGGDGSKDRRGGEARSWGGLWEMGDLEDWKFVMRDIIMCRWRLWVDIVEGIATMVNSWLELMEREHNNSSFAKLFDLQVLIIAKAIAEVLKRCMSFGAVNAVAHAHTK